MPAHRHAKHITLQVEQPFGKFARALLFMVTALTSILFVKLYRSNLLLSIVRPPAETTPSTLGEVVDAVEQGKEARVKISRTEQDIKKTQALLLTYTHEISLT